MKLDVYTPILSQKSLISYPRLAFPIFLNFWLIEFTSLNEYMWSYKPLNWVRLDPNERCAPLLPTSGGFQWCLHRSCSDEVFWKWSTKPTFTGYLFLKNHPFVLCVHTWKPLRGFLLRALKPHSQDQKARNGLLPFYYSKTNKNQNPPWLIANKFLPLIAWKLVWIDICVVGFSLNVHRCSSSFSRFWFVLINNFWVFFFEVWFILVSSLSFGLFFESSQ